MYQDPLPSGSRPPSSSSVYLSNDEDQEEEEEEEDDDEALSPSNVSEDGSSRDHREHQFSVLTIFVAALRKSLVTCGVEREDLCSMEIGWPTEVRHVSHVTFDRFNGFLGLPVEFQPELPPRVPSASISVFGVSAKSMQCSYDNRGNSVPTILLLMQRRLYSRGGLQAEGIFRINAENGQEEYVRNQLNKGVVPHGIDLHCLAGLIKAWFRELPAGVLDSLTPDQVMHCNTEQEAAQLVETLPPTEAALLDWAINLMADVVQHEHHNKMNARNIAMVFAPNMTQMVDPLTALIHAVQVMNFLKTLIEKTLREREESAAKSGAFLSCSESPSDKDDPNSSKLTDKTSDGSNNKTVNICVYERAVLGKFLLSPEDRLESDTEESFRSFRKDGEVDEEYEFISEGTPPIKCDSGDAKNGYGSGDVESFLDRLNLRKGVRKLCRHPVFQLSKPVKKSGGLGIVDSRGGGEAWA